MAAKKVGELIKDARTQADLTQEKLAKKVGGGLTASDISKAERGEMELTQTQLKKIAVATGVTQASLLNASKNASAKAAEKKTTAAKSAATKTTAKKTTTKKPTAAKTTTAKTGASAQSSMKVSATEKKLVEAYRTAESSAKKAALYLLQGESASLADAIIAAHSGNNASDVELPTSMGELLESVVGSLLKGK